MTTQLTEFEQHKVSLNVAQALQEHITKHAVSMVRGAESTIVPSATTILILFREILVEHCVSMIIPDRLLELQANLEVALYIIEQANLEYGTIGYEETKAYVTERTKARGTGMYFNKWAKPNCAGSLGREAMMNNFQIDEPELKGYKVIAASYIEDGYDGDAVVLLENNAGLLSWVFGSHCSCNGLEGQWEVELTTRAAIRHIIEEGYKLDRHGVDFVTTILEELKNG